MLSIIVLSSCGDIEVPHNPTQKVVGDANYDFDEIITPYIQELRTQTDNTAGLAIGITKGADYSYMKTFGYANIETNYVAHIHTPFHIASLSKPFTAVAIMLLVQEDKLKLDDRLVDHLVDFSMSDDLYQDITIKHILTHTSGISRHIAIDDWTNPSIGPDAMKENLEIIKSQQLDFIPGSQYSYSNSAFDILGLVIAEVSGKPFDQFLHDEIFVPIGMKHTSLKRSAGSDWSHSHSYGLATQVLDPFPYNERLFPSSGVVSSISDMCLWGQFHIGRGSLNGKEILSQELYQTIVSPQQETPWGDQIGLSWYLQTYLDRPIIMHTGSDTGFEAMMYIYPEDEVTVTVLANRDFSRTGRIVNAISEAIFDHPLKDYQLSAKYPFAKTYRKTGIETAMQEWQNLKNDTTDLYYVEDDDLLTTGAILENGGHWQQSKEILENYIKINSNSTYAWRLLGNDYLQLGDTTQAVSCYQKTLEINSSYSKGKKALESIL